MGIESDHRTLARVVAPGVSRSFPFQPFTPKLPFNLGEFISFKGC
jgi:hypothetical protein